MLLTNLSFVVMLLPFVLFLFIGICNHFLPKGYVRDVFAQGISTVGMIAAALCSTILFIKICLYNEPAVSYTLFKWFMVEDTPVYIGMMVDKLTAIMLFVTTVISACVHAYSIGYMREEKSKVRFFTYLPLMTFFMLVFVMAPNLLQMFLGWEGLSVSLYLLTGFKYDKESSSVAAARGFIMNRIADVGMLLGIFTVFSTLGIFDYSSLFSGMHEYVLHEISLFGFNVSLAEITALMFFIGIAGKAAMFGFHVWLVDSTEGPLPVLALVNSSTVVAGGVFLLCRLSLLYEVSPIALGFVAVVGILSAILAAIAAVSQKDLKRLLAYSTCSQMGYAVMAVGLSAYSTALVILIISAFVQALLFLGTGIIMNATRGHSDILKMGGLRLLLPFTYLLMLGGVLILIGTPPFAGFIGKEFVLTAAFAGGDVWSYIMYVLGLLGVGITSVYGVRMIILVFHGQFRGEKEDLEKVQDGELSMLSPMIILFFTAILITLVLWIMANVDLVDGNNNKWAGYVSLLPLLVGSYIAYLVYVRNVGVVKTYAEKWKWFYELTHSGWRVDDFYRNRIAMPLRMISHVLWFIGEIKILDENVIGFIARSVENTASVIRRSQTGLVFHYVFVVMLGISLLSLWLIL